MKLDFYAFQMNDDVQTAIIKLGEQERIAVKARKEKKKEEEREAENQRERLLGQIDSSLLYNYLQATEKADEDAIRTTWQKNLPPVVNIDWVDFVQDYPLDLTLLPFGSFLIQFTFKLLKPYISRDDNQFYIVDNPIVRDKVFRFPMIRPTAWKGSLRHALWQLGRQKEDVQIKRLFGAANDDKPDEGIRGRLHFYPTFFTKTSLEVINPHDRERRIGKNPILMESVPDKTTGVFTLLYAPLDRIGKDDTEIRTQTFADLQLAAEGLQAMFTVYGFGAKTSSGFGLADNSVQDGIIVVGGLAYKSKSPASKAASPAPQPSLPRYLIASDQLHPDFAFETGGLKSEAEYQQLVEGRGKKYTKKDKQLYGKAQKWWEREGRQLTEQATPEPEVVPESELPPAYPLARETFDAFDDLPAKTEFLVAALRQTGGDA